MPLWSPFLLPSHTTAINKATLPSDVTVGSRGAIAKAYTVTNTATHHPVMSKSCSLFTAIGMSVNTHVRQMRPTAKLAV